MNLKRIALTAVLFCVGLSSALAQFTSSIQGVVTDAAGAAVPEAVVRVTNVASGVGRVAVTSSEGLYRVLNLGPGTYRVEVAMKGFAPAERPAVVVVAGVPADRPTVVAAVSERARLLGLTAGSLVKAAASQLGGGGGGRDDVAQGGGAPLGDRASAAVDEAFNAVRVVVRDIAGRGGVA